VCHVTHGLNAPLSSWLLNLCQSLQLLYDCRLRWCLQDFLAAAVPFALPAFV
jgi:hypothetical protein